jgi:ketosteroid isomerase-like protein
MRKHHDQHVWLQPKTCFDAPLNRSIVSGTLMSPRTPSRTSRILVGLLLACVTFGLAAQNPHKNGHHPPKKMEREQVEDLEHQWSQAMLTGDVAALDKLLSDDYLGITASGDLLTKTQQLDRLRSRQLSFVKLDTTESKIKLLGRIAIVTSLAELDATSEGKPLNGAFRYVKVYQRLPNGTWRITSFEATHVRPGGHLGQRASVDSTQP